MSDDKNDKSWGLFGNPLPIVMVVLLAAGVLVQMPALQSARPTDPERVKFVPTSQQDVEARLWQDPFAAVEKHEKNSDQAVTPAENNLMMLLAPPVPNAQNEQCSAPAVSSAVKTPPALHNPEELCENIKTRRVNETVVTVVAVSVFGGSYAEDAEIRRRTRFAVVSALGFHGYHPEQADAIGYFHVPLAEQNAVKLTVPYEWFEKRNRDKSSNVLVLWLNEDKLSTSKPFQELQALFAKLTPKELANSGNGLTVKLIGPAGSGMLVDLVREYKNVAPKSGSTIIEVFSPNATISNCDLSVSAGKLDSQPPWDCFIAPPQLKTLTTLPIIRTTGTDDVLSAALLWELWQRGINRERGYVDPWRERTWATFVSFVKRQESPSFPRTCEDGLVLINERDTVYGRTLSRYLTEGFSERCGTTTPKPVRTFTYLRGLDGVLPDIDKSGSKAPPKDDSSKSKDLLAQLDDALPEHAEGRSQFDYLRRLADEIERLDHKKQFAINGVKAIGIVGSDLYDKLLILQALRSRFKNKIFFTTDLDARYLHADQKDWARNLVVASNFGLSLRPALQQSTLPFRDSYQTATYLATLMALEDQPFDWDGKMKEWLRPQIFEIGRTEAVHLASPSVTDLTEWKKSYSKDSVSLVEDAICDHDNWARCKNIEPDWLSQGLSPEHLPAILIMLTLGISLVALANRRPREMVRAVYDALTSSEHAEKKTAQFWLIGVATLVFGVLATIMVVIEALNTSLERGDGEPFVWLEGVSVWPSLVLRFIGLVIVLALTPAFIVWIRLQARDISKDFEFPPPQTRTLVRSKWSAVWTGPHLDRASFDSERQVGSKTANKAVEIDDLWRYYLRATHWSEMAGWIVICAALAILFGVTTIFHFGLPSFLHRGELVARLHHILLLLNVPVLWMVIFWVGYETRACARFIKILSDVPSKWPDQLLDRKAEETGVPSADLDDYLDFHLIVRVTKRIQMLIYLPFVLILFMVLARSNIFDAMDFPLALAFVTGLALILALYNAMLLRRSAESARATALKHYEARLLKQTRTKDFPPPAAADGAAAGPTRPPISVEQIKILMEHIRSTREGAFAPFAQQPALQALLLPFGGYGSAQLIEYLINFKM